MKPGKRQGLQPKDGTEHIPKGCQPIGSLAVLTGTIVPQEVFLDTTRRSPYILTIQ
ncbi:MAG: hypothetical protein K0R47_5122 [Brevibacillus sp.]|nr:hypothetical protein [Brevibacillus sp.]